MILLNDHLKKVDWIYVNVNKGTFFIYFLNDQSSCHNYLNNIGYLYTT